MGLRKKRSKCLQCEHIPCVNLYRGEGRGTHEGGELFVLERSLENDHLVPCHLGLHVQACCKLCAGAGESLGEDEYSPLLDILWQCLFDLRTSLFLVLFAHYRGAIQLLRPVIDNLVTGLYFEAKMAKCETVEEGLQLEADLVSWRDGTYVVSSEEWFETLGRSDGDRRRRPEFGFILEWLAKQKVLDGAGKQRLQRIWGDLNRHLHPSFKHMDIGSDKCASCPGVVAFDRERYSQWLAVFETLIDAVVSVVLACFPGAPDTELGKEGLECLKSLEWQEKELGIAIACPQFRESLRSLRNMGDPA